MVGDDSSCFFFRSLSLVCVCFAMRFISFHLIPNYLTNMFESGRKSFTTATKDSKNKMKKREEIQRHENNSQQQKAAPRAHREKITMKMRIRKGEH